MSPIEKTVGNEGRHLDQGLETNLDDLALLFEPRSAAIVGVPSSPTSGYQRMLRYLLENRYPGRLSVVNRRGGYILGCKAYPSLEDLAGNFDVVMSMVPASQQLEVLRHAITKDVKYFAVYASGFADGGGGKGAQQELLDEAKAHGVRLIGPNSQGILLRRSRFIATFAPAADGLRIEGGTGNGAAFVGQSGAVGGAFLAFATEQGLDVDLWAATGNEADIDSIEIAEYVVREQAATTIAMYLETIPDGRRFENLAIAARDAGIPIVVLRAGRSAAGQQAVASHTGRLVGNDRAFDLFCRDYGIPVVDDVLDLVGATAVISRAPRLYRRRIAVISLSGALGAIAADSLEALDFELPRLSRETSDAVGALLPPFASLDNPIDTTAEVLSADESAGPARLARIVETIKSAPEADGVLLALGNVRGAQAVSVAKELVSVFEGEPRKPLAVGWITGEASSAEGRQVLRENGIPVFSRIRDAAGALQWSTSQQDQGRDRAAQRQRRTLLSADQKRRARRLLEDHQVGSDILEALGVPQPMSAVVGSASEAAKVAAKLGKNIAIKATSAVSHKTEHGLVELNVSLDDVASAWQRIHDRVSELKENGSAANVLIQEMAPPGVEMFAAVARSEDGWPPVLVVGFGGIAVELDADVTSLLLPTSPAAIREALKGLRRGQTLFGYRGSAACDLTAFTDIALRLAEFSMSWTSGASLIEINPIIVGPKGQGTFAVDVLVQ